MYFRLTRALKRRVIDELRKYWSYHPGFPDLPDHIQGKYSFEERPSFGIIVKTNGGTRVDLAADNYIGIVQSYVLLTKVVGYDGMAIEWVREDALAIQRNGGRFPTAPGIYYIELLDAKTFQVESMVDVRHELVTMSDPLHGTLRMPPVNGTMRLYETPANYMLVEGVNYSLTLDSFGNPTGEVVLAAPLTTGRNLSADYRFVGPTVGPLPYRQNVPDNNAIPGCVLAFGSRLRVGDRMAVVVQGVRLPSALEFGGRWDITFDVDITARDPDAQQDISDQTVIYLWGILRARLSTEGIEMTDLQLGGESEEIYDDNGDDYFYNSTFSMTLQTDWSVHVPISLFLRTVSPLTSEQSKVFAGLPDDQIALAHNNLKLVESLGLESIVDPFFTGRSGTFETIG